MTDKMDELREYYDSTDTSDLLKDATLEQPDTTAEPMITYALRLPQPILDDLRAAADKRHVRVSTLMRTWLEERLGRDARGQDKVISVDDILALVAERGRPADRRTRRSLNSFGRSPHDCANPSRTRQRAAWTPPPS